LTGSAVAPAVTTCCAGWPSSSVSETTKPELSFSSYLVAADQGLPARAVPIFPRRLFSQSQLYKNAGAGIRKKLHEHTDEEWNFVLNTNLNAMFRGARAVLPHFIKKGSGNIVTTASTFGLLASAEYPSYCATKAAIVNLTREMALDYGPLGIRVNCVCPGAIETPRFRGFPPRRTIDENTSEEQRTRLASSNKALLRMGRPEEIAYGVLFLVSDEASFITGHALVIDGGQTIDA